MGIDSDRPSRPRNERDTYGQSAPRSRSASAARLASSKSSQVRSAKFGNTPRGGRRRGSAPDLSSASVRASTPTRVLLRVAAHPPRRKCQGRGRAPRRHHQDGPQRLPALVWSGDEDRTRQAVDEVLGARVSPVSRAPRETVRVLVSARKLSVERLLVVHDRRGRLGQQPAPMIARCGYMPLASPMRLPSGSVNCAIDGPPGTSIGGMTVLPPNSSALSRAACRSSTST